MLLKYKVFLGGTCGGSTWRDCLIPKLKIDYFNPVVDDWTEECQAEEKRQKDELCNIHLYVITPLIQGYFSIAEIMDSTNRKDVVTVVCVLEGDTKKEEGYSLLGFNDVQKKSLNSVCKMAKENGAIICDSLIDVENTLNSFANNYDGSNLDKIIDKTIRIYEQWEELLVDKGFTKEIMGSPKEYIIKHWNDEPTLTEMLYEVAPIITCQDNIRRKDKRWIDGATNMCNVFEKLLGEESKNKVVQYLYNKITPKKKKSYVKPIAELVEMDDDDELLRASNPGGDHSHEHYDEGCTCGCCGPWPSQNSCQGCPSCHHDNRFPHHCN